MSYTKVAEYFPQQRVVRACSSVDELMMISLIEIDYMLE